MGEIDPTSLVEVVNEISELSSPMDAPPAPLVSPAPSPPAAPPRPQRSFSLFALFVLVTTVAIVLAPLRPAWSALERIDRAMLSGCAAAATVFGMIFGAFVAGGYAGWERRLPLGMLAGAVCGALAAMFILAQTSFTSLAAASGGLILLSVALRVVAWRRGSAE